MDANPGRERILERIRAALAAEPPPGRNRGNIPNRDAGLSASGVFPPIDDSLARFRAECEANRTELHLVTAEDEAACLRELVEQERLRAESSADPGAAERRIFVQDAPELRRLMEKSSAPVRWSAAGPPQAADFAGLTLAEVLVARTGSVLITAFEGGRTASVLPPVHIVYARVAQLVSGLGEAIEHVQASGRVRDVSMLSLITGPSRTSDIEKMLVLGAHGPRRLAVLLRL